MSAFTLTSLQLPLPSELQTLLDRAQAAVSYAMLQQAADTEAQLHDFLCSGAMPRDLSLVQDRAVHRFDEWWRPPAPLRIR